jgi:hypothetical protein
VLEAASDKTEAAPDMPAENTRQSAIKKPVTQKATTKKKRKLVLKKK